MTEPPVDPVADDELAQRTRDGDMAAYAELWSRHARAGTTAARQFSSIADPDDIVSEAYLQILRALQRGGGPHEAFRPYLYRTIRNVALGWKERGRPTEELDDELEDTATDTETAVLGRTVTVRAFRTLPERWKNILWYTEVEGMEPAEAAPFLGLTPNGAAALAYRAREGLKKAWLQAHVNAERVPEGCRWTSERMAEYVRGGLTPRARKRFDEHLETCTRCSILVEEVDEIGGRLAAILFPVVLGGGAAAGMLAALHAATTGSGATAATGSGAVAAPATRAPLRLVTSPVAIVTGAAAAVVVVGAAVAAPMVLTSLTPPSTSLSASAPTRSPRPSSSTPSAEQTPSPPAPVVPEVPEKQLVPPRPPVRLVVSIPPPITTSPVTTPPVVTPPVVDPPAAPPAPPTIDAFVAATFEFLPDVAGGALPGATVVLADEDGPLGTTVAGADGRWTIPLPDPGRDGVTLTATQTDADSGLTSDPSTPTAPLVFDRPAFASPAEGTAIPSTGGATVVTVELTGVPGRQLEVLVDGVGTGNVHTLETDPIARVTEPLADGAHTIAIRYVDPATGQKGALQTLSFTIA